MSQQYPQQPNPQQPGWGGAPTPPGHHGPPFQPLPPKKSSTGKVIGLGCAGVVGLFVVGGVVSAIAGGGTGDESGASKDQPAASTSANERPTAEADPGDKSAKTAEPKEEKAKVVVFKVWGTAPAGALGPMDITYGSDSDSRQGKWKDGRFEATLPLNDDALYYTVTAQLQGSGDIDCSVTVDGHTEKAHAAGGYNICHAQANSGLLGGWD
ncbi:hypothetical protein [Streptomyces phaeoluteigriseus]|uniref:hypothetical protein n=1 Tax=Streptomyces phaeoluteigriseus TaxID=114686 RepID=UPI003696492B